MNEPVWIPYQPMGRNALGKGYNRVAMSLHGKSVQYLSLSPPAVHALKLKHGDRLIVAFSPQTGHIGVTKETNQSLYRGQKLTLQRTGVGRIDASAICRFFGIDPQKTGAYIELSQGTIFEQPALTARLLDWSIDE